MRQTGIGPALGDITVAAPSYFIGDRSTGNLFKGLDHVENRIALASTQVDGEQAALTVEVVKGGDMPVGQINHMDVVPYPGAIGCGVVIAPDVEKFSLAHGDLRNEGHQVVGDILRIFANQAGFMRADGIEIA